jgi:hypothetical protein
MACVLQTWRSRARLVLAAQHQHHFPCCDAEHLTAEYAAAAVLLLQQWPQQLPCRWPAAVIAAPSPAPAAAARQ